MLKFLTSLSVVCALAGPALAACAGTDLRPSLPAGERAEIDARLQAVPFASGNHWRAVRGDQTVHVIGTVHIDDPRLDEVTDRLAGVVQSSDIALFEMTRVEEQELKSAMTTRPDILFLDNTTLPEVMDEGDWQALMTALRDRGLPPAIASRFQPWYLSVLLALPPCLTASMVEGANGLDHRLMDVADAADVPTRALEPFDTLFSIFAEIPLDEQIEQLLLSVENDDMSEDMLATLRAAYFEERHAEVWEMARWQAYRMDGLSRARIDALLADMEAGLLSGRNVAWMPVILNALQTNDRVTVAAGAAHLNGAQGLLALLEAEGFTLERLPF